MLVILHYIFEGIIVKRMDLKSFHHTRKIFVPISGDYCSDHFAIYTNIKSLFCTPEIYIMPSIPQ